MTTTLKENAQIIVPPSIRRRAGLKPGDRLQFKVSGRIITIVPVSPGAEDEFTPAQRRALGAQLSDGLEDIRKGRVSHKFDTVDEMLASLKAKPARRNKTGARNR